jgi:hypothetical protein
MHALIIASIATALPMTTPSVGAAQSDADARLSAIYTAEWNWREQQLPDEEDSQKPIQDHLPKIDPGTAADAPQVLGGGASQTRSHRPHTALSKGAVELRHLPALRSPC